MVSRLFGWADGRTDRAHMIKAGDTGLPGVIQGDPQESSLVLMITAEEGDQPAMPKGKDPLQKEEVELISQWILQGKHSPSVQRDPHLAA